MSAFHDDEEPVVNLNLVALMDILSNLLFFLLASYSAQAMEVTDQADLKLPPSSSQFKLTPSLTIKVTRSQIQVADVTVARIAGPNITGTAVEGEKIVTVFDRLTEIKTSRKAANAELAASDTFLLFADRGTDSAVITKVLKTAGMAGFPNVRFGVIAQ